MQKEQLSVEMTLTRRFNTGNFSHKEYTIKISGTEELMEKQLEEKKAKLNSYLRTLDELIETAHEANMNKDEAKV
jgi:hypothetical protein